VPLRHHLRRLSWQLPPPPPSHKPTPAFTSPTRSGTIKVVAPGSTATVITPDVMAGNSGVVHVIDSMLIPVRLPAGTLVG
jgi:hypothetical protein